MNHNLFNYNKKSAYKYTVLISAPCYFTDPLVIWILAMYLYGKLEIDFNFILRFGGILLLVNFRPTCSVFNNKKNPHMLWTPPIVDLQRHNLLE
jgi:hypothetical protein